MGVIPEAHEVRDAEGVPKVQQAEAVHELARRLDLPLLPFSQRARDLPPGQAVIAMIHGVPMIQLTGRGVAGPVTVDFGDKSMAQRRRAGHNELLGKAVGWKQAHAPRVLDGTGGFGRDAFLLADLGCEITVCERNPVMAALLDAALERAAGSGDDWLASVVARMTVHHQDARSLTPSLLEGVEVIYLDPMFPLDRRAAPAKEMQILHELLSPWAPHQDSAVPDSPGRPDDPPSQDVEDAALLAWARAQNVKRVVVKRPRRAPVIDGPLPGHSLTGKAVRFDVYPVSREAPI